MIRKSITLLITLCLSTFLSFAAGKSFVLVVDPGHGGKDPGAIGAISMEKDINLKVALSFGKYVEKHCPDVRVVYTRTTDVFIDLHERAAIANREKADAFISIHTNSNNSKAIKGFQTYTLGLSQEETNLDVAKRENSVLENGREVSHNPNSSESTIMFEVMQAQNMENSVQLARFVQTAVCGLPRPDMGVHQANLCVLRESSMPGCLVELGFISNPEEELSLNTPYTQDQIARAMYQAFVRYKDKTCGRRPTGKTDVPAMVSKPSEPAKPAEPANQQKPEQKKQTPAAETERPVFKVQIMSGTDKLKENHPHFKGLSPVESIEEGGLIRYTYGSTTDYNEILATRRSVAELFPEAFIVAYKNGQRIPNAEAVAEWKRNR